MSTLQTSNRYAVPLELPAHHGEVYYRKLNPEDDELLLEDWKTVNAHEEQYKKAVEKNPKYADEKWILSEIEKRYRDLNGKIRLIERKNKIIQVIDHFTPVPVQSQDENEDISITQTDSQLGASRSSNTSIGGSDDQPTAWNTQLEKLRKQFSMLKESLDTKLNKQKEQLDQVTEQIPPPPTHTIHESPSPVQTRPIIHEKTRINDDQMFQDFFSQSSEEPSPPSTQTNAVDSSSAPPPQFTFSQIQIDPKNVEFLNMFMDMNPDEENIQLPLSSTTTPYKPAVPPPTPSIEPSLSFPITQPAPPLIPVTPPKPVAPPAPSVPASAPSISNPPVFTLNEPDPLSKYAFLAKKSPPPVKNSPSVDSNQPKESQPITPSKSNTQKVTEPMKPPKPPPVPSVPEPQQQQDNQPAQSKYPTRRATSLSPEAQQPNIQSCKNNSSKRKEERKERKQKKKKLKFQKDENDPDTYWPEPSSRRGGIRKYFESIVIRGVTYRIGDMVEVSSNTDEPWVAEITYLFECSSQVMPEENGKWVKFKWFEKWEDCGLKPTMVYPNEIFKTENEDRNRVYAVEGKCTVVSDPNLPPAPKQYLCFRTVEEAAAGIHKPNSGNHAQPPAPQPKKDSSKRGRGRPKKSETSHQSEQQPKKELDNASSNSIKAQQPIPGSPQKPLVSQSINYLFQFPAKPVPLDLPSPTEIPKPPETQNNSSGEYVDKPGVIKPFPEDFIEDDDASQTNPNTSPAEKAKPADEPAPQPVQPASQKKLIPAKKYPGPPAKKYAGPPLPPRNTSDIFAARPVIEKLVIKPPIRPYVDKPGVIKPFPDSSEDDEEDDSSSPPPVREVPQLARKTSVRPKPKPKVTPPKPQPKAAPQTKSLPQPKATPQTKTAQPKVPTQPKLASLQPNKPLKPPEPQPTSSWFANQQSEEVVLDVFSMNVQELLESNQKSLQTTKPSALSPVQPPPPPPEPSTPTKRTEGPVKRKFLD